MKNSAFTLIELLVVIVIIGILATIGIAQFNSYQEQARLAKALSFASQVERSLVSELTATSLAPAFVLKFEEGVSGSYKNYGGRFPDCTGAPNANMSTDTPNGSQFSFRELGGIVCPGWINLSPVNNTEFTISVWLKSPDLTYHANFVNNGAALHLLTDGSIGARISGETTMSEVGVFELDKWQHFVLSYDAGRVRLWKDGNLVFNKTNTNVSFTGGAMNYVLYNNTGPIGHGDFHQGLIDDFAYYPIAFTGF